MYGTRATHLLRGHIRKIRPERPFRQKRQAEDRREALGGLDEECLYSVNGHGHALIPPIPQSVFVNHLGETPQRRTLKHIALHNEKALASVAVEEVC